MNVAKRASLGLIIPALVFGFIPTADAGDQKDLIAGLKKSLTMHASFDQSLDADFSRGDRQAYVPVKGAAVPAALNNDVSITAEPGKFGKALHFTRKSGYRPFYKGDQVLNYNGQSWSTSVSCWIKTNPDLDLEPGYCDPLQIVGGDVKKGFIFLEWSKDHSPRKFRYAVRPLYEIWNPTAVGWEEIPSEKRPMIELDRPIFSRDQWTHVVFTLHDTNDSTKQSHADLYINGELQGSIQNWNLKFGWKPEDVQLVLGALYVGQLDDLAVFNRGLSAAEVKAVYGLKNGIADLK